MSEDVKLRADSGRGGKMVTGWLTGVWNRYFPILTSSQQTLGLSLVIAQNGTLPRMDNRN
jgi:hypothetical protein